MGRSATLEAGGVIHWSTKAARMLAMVFTEIATRALRILERPFFEVDLYLMRTKGVSPPPTENIVAPQTGNSRSGAHHVLSRARSRRQHYQLASQDSTTSAPYSFFQALSVR